MEEKLEVDMAQEKLTKSESFKGDNFEVIEVNQISQNENLDEGSKFQSEEEKKESGSESNMSPMLNQSQKEIGEDQGIAGMEETTWPIG